MGDTPASDDDKEAGPRPSACRREPMNRTTAWRRAAVMAVLACAPWLAHAQAGQQPEARPEGGLAAPEAAREAAHAMHAVRLEPGEAIVLDGTLDAPAWHRAPVHDDFVEHDPANGARPKYRTTVRVLFDESAIYVGVEAFDDHPEQIVAPLVRHDGVLRTQDFVVLYLDAIGKRQSAQFFRVNAAGSIGDGMHTAADDDEDFSPDFDFDAAAARNAHGYTAVFRVPFASLRFASDARAGWRIMVARRLPREQAYMWTSVPVPVDAPAFISALQPLEGIELPGKSSFLSVRPSMTIKRSTDSPYGEPTHVATGVQGSLDVKWRASPELVVDGTLKPDFSQVALDVPQLSGNSAFALYLPEKRPFFFESADLLHSPTDALYTRSFTSPRWGLRSTWRGASLAGTALVVDDQGGGETLLPYAYGTDTAVQPGSRAIAARLRGDVDDAGRLQLGAIAALRRYEGGRGDNDVAGPDIAWQVNDAWRLRAQWLHSSTTAQPDAQGGLSRGAETHGDELTLLASRLTDRTQLDIEADDFGPGFRHDTGFVNQVGIRELVLHEAVVFRQLGPTNELWLNLKEGVVTDHLRGDVIQEYVTPRVWMSGAHNTEFSIEWRGFSKIRTAATGRLASEHYWKAEYLSTLAGWLPQVDASLNLGRMADAPAGVTRPGGQVNLAAKMRPFGPLELEPSVWAAWLRRDGVTTYRETASQLLGVWHFDARQNLRLIVQRTTYDRKAEPGVDADHESGLTSSLTYAYRRSMGTVLYVGATRSHRGVVNESIARGTEAFVKLQVDLDEARAMF
jgi:hypothetical protein